MPTTLLTDNGSSRPDSTLTLRALAGALARRIGEPVHPVSLLHADKVPADALGGRAADTLEPYLRRALAEGARDFRVLPLLFGPSRALSQLIPETADALSAERGPFAIRVAPELCPLPQGESRLTTILLDHIQATAKAGGGEPRRVVLVDHGSPIPEVTAVRSWLATQLRARLGPGVTLVEAAMERRPGPAYDFNGDLLETALGRLAETDPHTPVILALLFLSPGRHAGSGGDIETICAAVEARIPGFRVLRTPLVAAHPALVEILADRHAAVDRDVTYGVGDPRRERQ